MITRTWIAATLLVFSCSSTAFAADLSADGSIDASWTSARLVSPSPDAVLRAGYTVTISISGQVDINQDQKSRNDCAFLGMFCHTTSWTEHHFQTPTQLGVTIKIQTKGGGQVVKSQSVGSGGATIELPADASNFSQEYEIVGALNGAGSSIDGGRSAGLYVVHIEIDASNRADAYADWLTGMRPDITGLVSAELVNDRATVQGHPHDVADALRAYAAQDFPIAQPPDATSTNAKSQLTLLQKAVLIAPDEADNSIALADLYNTLGLGGLADQTYDGVIGQLTAKNDPGSQRQLGDAYEHKALNDLATNGGVDEGASANAISLLAKAYSAYHKSRRSDLEAAALFERARVLRGQRTIASLQEAAENLKEALTLVPDSIDANTVLESTDHKRVSLRWTYDFSLENVQSTSAAERTYFDRRIIIGWDPFKQRVLTRSRTLLEWDSPTTGSKIASPPVTPVSDALAANGAILAIDYSGAGINYIAADDSILPIASSAQPCGSAPSGNAPAQILSNLRGASLSRDGIVVGTLCGTTARIFHYDGTQLQTIYQKDIKSFGASWEFVSAGPFNCGVVISRTEASTQAGQPANQILELIHPDQTVVQLSKAAVPIIPIARTIWAIEASDVAFTADAKILIRRQLGQLDVFRCDSGVAEAPIILPTAPVWPPIAFSAVPSQTLQWTSPTSLAIIQRDSGRVLVLEWPSRRVAVFPLTALSVTDLWFFAKWAFPPIALGNAPRFLRPHRPIEARPLADDGSSGPPTKFDDPSWLDKFLLLPGGKRLLIGGNTPGKMSVVDISTGQTQPVAAPGAGLVPVRSDQVDSWSALVASASSNAPSVVSNFGGWGAGWYAAGQAYVPSYWSGFVPDNSSFEVLDQYVGIAPPVSVPMPVPGPKSVIAIEAAIQGAANGFAQQPDAMKAQRLIADTNLAYFPSDQLKQAGTDATRVRYAIVAPSATNLNAQDFPTAPIVCAIPEGVPTGSAQPLPFNFGIFVPSGYWGPTPIWTLNHSASGLSFTEIPPPPQPPGFAFTGPCQDILALAGTTPVVTGRNGPPGMPADILRFDGTLWTLLASQTKETIVAGNSIPDGSGVVLTSQPPGKLSIKYIPPSGAWRDLCTACSSIDLLAEQKKFIQGQKTKVPYLPDFKRPVQMPDIFVPLLYFDESDRLLAYPDGDETVVISVPDDQELARVPLSVPIALNANSLISDDGNGHLTVHKF